MENTSQLIDSFSQFLSEKVSQKKDSLQGYLISFLKEISQFDIESKIGILLKSSECSFYFSSAGNKYSFLGLDNVFSINENGPARFISTDKKLKELSGKLISNNGFKNIPHFIGGMKFTVEHSDEDWKDFSDTNWFIPEILIYRLEEKTFLVYNHYVEQSFSKSRVIEKFSRRTESLFQIKNGINNSFPRITRSSGLSPKDKKKWKQMINLALEKINDRKINKIVLARKVELILSDEFNLSASLILLKNDYPECAVFAFHKGNSTFFGATPELLTRIYDNKIEVDAIAGSIDRGGTNEEDNKFESDLLNSKKDFNEHQYVLEHLITNLKNISKNISFSDAPEVKKLKNIQHLFTKISAELKDNTGLMNLLKQLHPTPAVCGFPKDAALNLIKKIENQRRGLYSGIIGWFNFNNEGEFSVSIRSALTKGNKLIAYAGSGIVEGSEPDSEFEETELKLKPILSLFNEKKD